MKALAPLFAALALIAAPVSASEFTAEQKGAIDEQIRAYILANPEVILEAMDVLEQRTQQLQAKADRELLASLGDELINDGFSHIAGNPDGDVTVIEFLDYRCGYCKRAHGEVKALVGGDPNIRYVIKEFPILGPDSTLAARTAMAALRQDDELYMTLNDELMRHNGNLDQGALNRIVAEVGIDIAQLRKDIADPQIAANIRETYALARKLDISGTPAFIIGDQIIRGYVPYDTLRELVEDAREAG
ncbi:MAG: DsbA family protein [Pseudomonadota bacterium]